MKVCVHIPGTYFVSLHYTPHLPATDTHHTTPHYIPFPPATGRIGIRFMVTGGTDTGIPVPYKAGRQEVLFGFVSIHPIHPAMPSRLCRAIYRLLYFIYIFHHHHHPRRRAVVQTLDSQGEGGGHGVGVAGR